MVGWLVCTAGPDRGRDYRIRSERNFIGRGDEMDIAIRGDDTISRDNHASITFNPRNRQFRLHSGTGRGLVYSTSEQIDNASTLKHGDRIDLGQNEAVLRSARRRDVHLGGVARNPGDLDEGLP